jgi:hypothetical protein
MTQILKKPVSERALFARLSRALEKEGVTLKKCRSDSRWYRDFGDYYSVCGNAVRDTHISLEDWARRMEVLQPWEILKDD